MTTSERTAVWHQPGLTFEDWHTVAHRQLDQAYRLSPLLLFDDSSRLVFFSDLHRGVNNRDDLFAGNAALFQQALTYYYRQDYTYIEVGDGDELWHNRHFRDIRRAYGRLFDLLDQFQKRDRLHMIVGNHDSQQGLFDPVEKAGIPLHQGVVLTHAVTGQRLFAVHGHQADPNGDFGWSASRLHSRYFWKYCLRLGIDRFYHFAEPQVGLPQPARLKALSQPLSDRIMRKAFQLETATRLWLAKEQQIVISGHTHMFNFPQPDDLPHFNIGHGTTTGYITGLEIEQGQIRLVKWANRDGDYVRSLLQQRPLSDFHFR